MKKSYKKYLTIVNLLLLFALLTSCTLSKDVSETSNTGTTAIQNNDGWAEETNDLELKGGEALPVESEVEQTLDWGFNN